MMFMGMAERKPAKDIWATVRLDIGYIRGGLAYYVVTPEGNSIGKSQRVSRQGDKDAEYILVSLLSTVSKRLHREALLVNERLES